MRLRSLLRETKLTREERSWAMYDWANSVYATIIITAIFPIYFTDTVAATGRAGDATWATGTSIATACMAVLAPVFGSLADFRGMKKRLLVIFMLTGVFFTLTMAVFDSWQLMLLGFIISYIGYALGNLFYDGFLTDVTTPERMDMVSAKGYAYGYIGGSTIPFVFALLLIVFSGQMHLNNTITIKLCILLTSFWWGLFSLPLLRNVRQKHFIETKPGEGLVRAGFRNLRHTARDIVRDRPLRMFLLAYFFYIDGVNTVIKMATSYGTTLGLGTVGMVGALMVTQLVAVPCSVAFAHVSRQHGTRTALLFGAAVYFIVCLLGFYMGFSLENAETAAAAAALEGGQAAYDAIYQPALARSQRLFWLLSFLVGTSQGGMQALSRSQFGRMIPPQRSNEFFGFFDVFGKFAAVLGPFLYALVVTTSGRSSLGVLSLSLLFATGMLLLLLTPKSAFQNQKPLSAAPMPAADAAAGTAPGTAPGAAAPGQK